MIDGKLNCLLVKRNVEPFKGSWALPGGLKTNESSDDAFERELIEEAQFGIQVLNYKNQFKSYLIQIEILEMIKITRLYLLHMLVLQVMKK